VQKHVEICEKRVNSRPKIAAKTRFVLSAHRLAGV
jgi:hypothetical protein